MENSKIEWTDHTFNPWWGCIKVSPGCEHCYAETFSKRTGHNIWGPAKTTQRRLFGDKHWAEPLKWNKAAEAAGKRQRVFCASMADVFEDHPQAVGERQKLFGLIERTPALDWLLLTKRPENIMGMLPDPWLYRCSSTEERVDRIPDNVWIGTSVEDQANADKRIPELLKIPARIRFLSCEPLLGPINLRLPAAHYYSGERIAWIIAGGESGHHARPMHPDWARSIRDQCIAAGVPFHFKQFGEYAPSVPQWFGNVEYVCSECGRHSHIQRGHCEHDWRQQATMIKIGKHAAGRLLDGAEWSEFPS